MVLLGHIQSRLAIISMETLIIIGRLLEWLLNVANRSFQSEAHWWLIPGLIVHLVLLLAWVNYSWGICWYLICSSIKSSNYRFLHSKPLNRVWWISCQSQLCNLRRITVFIIRSILCWCFLRAEFVIAQLITALDHYAAELKMTFIRCLNINVQAILGLTTRCDSLLGTAIVASH